MSLPRSLCYSLLAVCVILVPSSSEQSEPSTASAWSIPAQQKEIDGLLRSESEALDHYQQHVAPAIRCENADNGYGQTCHDMSMKLRDEAEQTQRDIARYRTSSAQQPVDLFDIYVDLQSLLHDIEILAVEDEYNGSRNQDALAEGYDSFIKITGVWFTGVMRETVRNLASTH